MLRAFEVIISIILVIVFVTQVILPLYRGQRVFPLFRAQGKLEAKLAEVTQEAEEEKVLDRIVTKMHHDEPKAKKTTNRNKKG